MTVEITDKQIKNPEISLIQFEEVEKWNEIVKSFEEYDVYYLVEYVKAFNIHGDGEPYLIYYEDQNIMAMNVVMKRDISTDKNFVDKIPSNTYYDIVTPYGYGGFLIEGKMTKASLEKLDDNYRILCKDNEIISEFIRFHPVLGNEVDLEKMYDITTLGRTVTVDLVSKKNIWDNLTSKNRNMIRKSIKSDVEVFWGRSSILIDKFIKLYNSTMDKENADNYYYFDTDFYNSVLNDLKYNFSMFYAVHDGEIIAMSMILHSNNQVHYHLSASDRKYQSLGATNLLLYEVACWACDNDYKTFHLGGGLGSKEDNLYNFKKVFNKNSTTTFSIGRKIFNTEMYNKLVEIRDKNKDFNNQTSFFPKYRG